MKSRYKNTVEYPFVNYLFKIDNYKLLIANYRLHVIHFILLLASCIITRAQMPIELQAAIDTALKNNLSLRNEKLNAEYLKALQKTAWNIPQTGVSAEYGQFNSIYNDNRFVISQAIKFPTVYTRQKQLYTEEWKAGVLGADIRERDIKTEVTNTFYELIYLQKKKQLLQHSDTIYADFLEKASLRFKTGETNILEKTTAETQRGQIARQLNELQQDLKVTQLHLQLLLNSTTEFFPKQDSFKLQLKAIPDTSLLIQHPYIQQLAQQQEINSARLKLERSKLAPDLIAAYNNTTIKGIGADDKYYSLSRRFQSVQVGVGIPLFSGSQRNLVKAMNINAQAAQNNYEAGIKSMQSRYEQALLQYNKIASTINYYESSALPNANTIIQTANDQFQNGDINYLDWVLLTNQAIQIQNEYIDAVRELNKSVIEINSYINQ